MSQLDWYRRFGEVPGVSYGSPQPIRRLKLTDARPKTFSFKESSGHTISSLMWPSEDGGETSASPAGQHGIDMRGASPDKVITNLRETLELPGTVSDYHFAIQSAADALWPRRHDDPSLVETVAEFSLLDIRLIEAHPEAITDEFAKEKSYYAVDAFSRLTSIYLREGLVREALQIARIGARFDQAVDVEDIESRLAAIDAEPQQ